MFLDGYIGAPPTIVVVSAATNGTGPATVAMTAKAATPARRIAEMRFIVCSDLVDCVLVSVETLPVTERQELRMRGGTHMFVSLPLPMTGPVGWPVGEPPGGSSETARSASRLAPSAKVAEMAIWVGRSEGKTPRGSGLPPGGTSHSSGTRVGAGR